MSLPSRTGQIWPSYGSTVSVLDDLTDVDTTTVTPTDGDVLYYDGTEWRPAQIVTDGTDPLVDANGAVIYT